MMTQPRSLLNICCLLGLLFSSACSSRTREDNIAHAMTVVQYKHALEPLAHKEGSFTMEQTGIPSYPASPKLKLRLQTIDITPKVSGMLPGSYIIYCPSAGDPSMPEVAFPVTVNEFGKISTKVRISRDAPEVLARTILRAYAIPGFSYDWYMIRTQPPRRLYHTTFDFQPIIATGTLGQTVQLMKKECGGNLIEVVMKGFNPNEAIVFSSNSEGEEFCRPLTMDEQGCRRYTILPAVQGKQKGVASISVTTKNERIMASSDWDVSTLNIRRSRSGIVLGRTLIEERYKEIEAQGKICDN